MKFTEPELIQLFQDWYNFSYRPQMIKHIKPEYIPKHTFSVWKNQTKNREYKLIEGVNGIPKRVLISEGSKITKRDTNGFTKLILTALRSLWDLGTMKDKQVRRISSEGRYRKGVGFISGLNKGMGDIEGVTNEARAIYIEVKHKDKLLKEQSERYQMIVRTGGIAIVATDFGQFLKEYTEKSGIPPKPFWKFQKLTPCQRHDAEE